MNGVTPQEKHAKLIKEIKALENRLDKANQKYNSTVAFNKKMRDEIDTLRRERLVFEQIYSKLTSDLETKKKEMDKIVAIANTATQDREEATKELIELIRQAEEEKANFDQQIQQVNQKIEKEKQMKEFMKAKESEQNELERLYKETKQEQELNLKRQSQKAFWGFSGDKVSQVLIPEEKLEEYQESFNRILKATGAKDIDELVRNFIEAEERNFTLSKFVGELTVETEQLEEQIVQIKKEIEEYKNQGLGENNERKKLQKELEEKIRRNEESYEAHMTEYKATLDKISSIKTSIEEIFTLAGENNETAKRFRALQESQGLTQDNIMQYLGMVEEMINEMIKQYAFLLAQKLKVTKDLDDDDPVIVTLHNILMVAPKTEGTRYDQLNVKEDLAQQEEMIAAGQLEDDENPLDFNDFQKRFQSKMIQPPK